ncbi:RDD family protein [Legionella cardiaca]|uniref:RDD family protein n=1 Tax=Legionella cardiaca TaxID=1071983 RepID=A0ABY8AR80_9GAMM|nr:RDD family protein [Legionella cardiaca]WED43187.1 RDD family protein [Legionella cardiaca]
MLLKYIAAQIYDGLILLALFFAFTVLCIFINHGLAIPPATRWYQIGLTLLFISYYIISIIYGGQTIGMRAWRLQLCTDKGFPNFQQATTRLFLTVPAIIYGLLCLKNPQTPLYNWTKTRLKNLQ